MIDDDFWFKLAVTLARSQPFLEPLPPDESDDESHPPQLIETEDEFTGDSDDE